MLLALSLVFTSCDELIGEWDNLAPNPVAPTPTPVSVTSITLNKPSTTLNVGATETLTATICPDDAADKSVTWSSSELSVATVDQNGVVTAVAVGTAIITATAKDGSDVTGKCTVTVKGLLSGKFRINASGKQVQFSQGNLQATYDGTEWTWGFAANQWDYIGNAAGNTSVAGAAPWISAPGTVDLFGWSTANTYFGINNSTDNATYSGDFVEWGTNIGTGWRTLTGDDDGEWYYLINSRTTGGTVFGTASARFAHAGINTDGTPVKGLILFPDGVDIADSEVTTAGTVNHQSDWGTRCTSAQWTALAAKGCVFLPAAGYREGTTVTPDKGYYWSSTPHSSELIIARNVDFRSSSISYSNSTYRYRGCSVRLVRDVE